MPVIGNITPTTGGGGLTFPDSIVTGSGSYVIPVGFNSKVTDVCSASATFSINGFQALEASDSSWLTMMSLNSPQTYNASSNRKFMMTVDWSTVFNGGIQGSGDMTTKSYKAVSAGYMAGEDDPNNPGNPLVEDTLDLAFAQHNQPVVMKKMTAWPYNEQGQFTGIVLEE